MEQTTVILIQSIIFGILAVYFALSIVMRITIRKRIKGLFDEAANTDGGHHKQWYLHKIADELAIKLDSDDEGIAP